MYSIKEIANLIHGTVIGDSNLTIDGVCGIDDGKIGYISFIGDSQYLEYLDTTDASAVIVQSNQANLSINHKTLIEVDNPALSFSKVISLFHEDKNLECSISKNAIIDKNTQLGKNIHIGHNTVIAAGVSIGDNVFIGSGCYIGTNCLIDSQCHIANNVTLIQSVILGQNVKINSGSVVGGSGFGLFLNDKKHFMIPHIGKVIIGDDVSIGSNCCIDRGSINDTKIGSNTQIDNLVQIAHNVQLGNGCVIAGQTGIAGSTILGDSVTIGGQVGIVGHIKISNNVTIAGKSLVTKSINNSQLVSGIPAKNHKQRIKQEATLNRLPKMIENIKK